jgi:glycosyltransferase involved in cell wall biosynthesis
VEISAVLIVLNEEKRLEPALKSVQGVVSEIVVVDGGSTDGTVRLAKRYTDKVFERKWTNFADQKNFANSRASRPWILSLDADERLSPELKEEIAALKEGEPACAGFSIPRQVHYLGRWIRHSGWYPDRKVRLFRADRARWEGDFVHEKLVFSGPVDKLMGPIHHFTYAGIADHVARINRFSDLGAQKLYAKGRKCGFIHLVGWPAGRFLRSYVLKLGILDGFPGFVIAVLNGYSVFIRYAKLREIWKKGERIEPFSY